MVIKRSARGLVVQLRTGGPLVDGWSTCGRVVRPRTGSPPMDFGLVSGRVVRQWIGGPTLDGPMDNSHCESALPLAWEKTGCTGGGLRGI